MRKQQAPKQRAIESTVSRSDRGGGRRARAGGVRRACVRAAGSLVLLLLLAVSTQAQGASCPVSADGVPVGMKGIMCAFAGFEIKLAGVTTSGFGFQCDGVRDHTEKVWPKLVPDTTYTLTAGNGICVTTINFDVPECYALYIDGKEANQIHKQDELGRIFSGDGTWKVVLRRKCPCSDGEQSTPALGSVIWQTGMGNLSDGRPAESIGIREKALSSRAYTPAALVYSPPGLTDEVDVVRSEDGSLRQVKAPQMLADVVTLGGSEFEIRYYRPADIGIKTGGLYPVSGQPFVVWKIKNPDPSTTSRLQISKTQGGVTETSEYAWDAAVDSWSLTTGNGARVETRTVSYPTQTSRKETYTVKDSTGQIASRKALTYQTFPWGEELVQEVLDPDASALTTTYAFYEDPDEEWSYRKRKSVTFPDGSWEKYEYDFDWNKSVVLRPWKDVTLDEATISNSRATLYRYTFHNGYEPFSYRKYLDGIEEQIEGKVVSAMTVTRWSAENGVPITVNGQPVVLEREAVYTSLSVQQRTTTIRYHSSLLGFASAPDFLANRVASVEHPDGTKETHAYEKGTYIPDADPALSRFTPDPNGRGERATVVHGTVAAPDGVAFKTTKETTVRDEYGNPVLRETYVYNGTDYERVSWSVSAYDERGRLTQTTRNNGQVTSAVWSGDYKTSEVDESGVETAYTYDSLGRVKTRTKKGVAAGGGFPAQPDITTTYTYDAAGRVLGETTAATAASGELSLTNSSTYDKAGRVKSRTDEAGLTTTHAYANGGRKETVTLPGGATRVVDKYLDRQLKSVTGTAVVAQHFDYGLDFTTTTDATLYTKVFGDGGLNSPRWKKTTIDWLGRTIKVETPGFGGATFVQSAAYDQQGRLLSETTKSGASRLLADKLYEYDELGRQVRTGLDTDASGTLLAASTDRLTETDTVFEKSGADWFRVTTTKSYLADNDPTATTQTKKERLANFAANGAEKTVADVTLTDEAGNTSRTTSSVERAAKKTTDRTDTPDSTLDIVSVGVNGLPQTFSPATPESPTTYAYDALGRQTSVTDPRTGTTTSTYSPTTGQLASVSDTFSTVGYEYYAAAHASAGQLKSQTNSAGKRVHFNYNSRGQIAQTWGEATTPIECVYDAYGQKTELRTFRNGQNWAAATWPAATTGTADVTRWVYHEPTGLLERKQDAATRNMSFTYDTLGRPLTRTWARLDGSGNPLVTTYSYDANTGEMSGVNYSDSTPDVTLVYDRGGRQKTITDAAGTHTRVYNVQGELENDRIEGGLLDSVQVHVTYDQHLRRQFLQASHEATVLSGQTYGYDASSRLETITSGTRTATYSYHPNTGLLTTTAFNGGTNISRSYDGVGRLQTLTTSPASGGAQSYTYTYNNLHQRTRVTREDGSYWSYVYNDRGELATGKKYWADNTPALGSQTAYDYDSAGNRKSAGAGGNELGSLRQSAYSANSLNQYTQRSVPGAVDVTGTAHVAATVAVNNQATARRGEYFYKELAVNNGAAPVSAQINVTGARNNFGAGGEDAVTEKGGRVFVPRAVEAYTYDADGNLTSDGRWSYTWDAENRLVRMEAAAGVPAEARGRLEFAYDYLGRRIQKKVYAWDSLTSGYVLQAVRKFVGDGWNVVAELDGNNALVRSFVWGQDVSGTLQEAGGVGGLLLIQAGGQAYQAGYDGGGNLTSLTDAGTGAVAASYEYDPFGATLKAVGGYAHDNPFRFSTKYADAETGLLYYGHRYYNPQTGAWLNRDPMGEAGGVNLYGFVGNDPVNRIDPTGLYEIDVHYYLTYYLASRNKCFSAKEAKLIAEGNQTTDEDPDYAPHWKSVLPGPAGEAQRRRNAQYHALTKEENHPGNLEKLWIDATCGPHHKDPEWNYRKLGVYLHYLQDMFSHKGFESSRFGHGYPPHVHRPDKTDANTREAVNMARATWDALQKFAKEKKCGCQGNWDRDVSLQKIIDFVRQSGGPRTREINNRELERKRTTLGVPRR